jgi:methyl-accepting chemotaxis protein
MSWKSFTIGKKIGVGFAVVLFLLLVLGILSYLGVHSIVENATEVIDGNKLNGELAQKEVDHLNWMNKVSALLSDDKVTSLNVETDDHKCGFGKWLFGEGRRQAEQLVPSLAPLFKGIEGPHHQLHQSAVGIGKNFQQADVGLPGFLCAREVDHLEWVAKVDALFLNNLPKLVIQTDPHKCSLGKWIYGGGAQKACEGHPELAKWVEALKAPHAKLHGTAVDIRKVYKQTHPGLMMILLARLDDHHKWAAKISQGIIEGKQDFGVQTDPSKCAFGKFLKSEKAAAWMRDFPALKAALEASKTPHDRLHASALDIEKAMKEGNRPEAEVIFLHRTMPALAKVSKHLQDAINAEEGLIKGKDQGKHIYETETLPALDETSKAIRNVQKEARHLLEGAAKANEIYATQTIPALVQTQKILNDLREEAKKHIMTDEVMLNAAKSTQRDVTMVGIAAIIIGIFLAFFISRGIVAVLQRVSNQMADGASQVASASAQVSSSSQSLAEGASEQAAAIEETSASLEEISSMTKNNADNAQEADGLMKEASSVVNEANQSMQQVISSMTEISKASEETQKIIKTIDEIAFQTNLLALNAAVEAARAGEAGAGFAVVADEVRNLAIRAADAAKNTADLIEGTVKRVTDGTALVHRTNEAFVQVSGSTSKVGELVGEISAASNDQAKGVEEVNNAVTEMDKVTQQNAANAEESASASEEMNAQAEQMSAHASELMSMVGGRSFDGHTRPVKNVKRRPFKKAERTKALMAPVKKKEAGPEEILPLDDEDFKDF